MLPYFYDWSPHSYRPRPGISYFPGMCPLLDPSLLSAWAGNICMSIVILTFHNIMAARAVYREFSIYKNTVKRGVFGFLDFGGHFWFFYDIPEAPEVFKNLPRPRGFVVLQYGPVASHGDHVHARNYNSLVFLATLAWNFGPNPTVIFPDLKNSIKK